MFRRAPKEPELTNPEVADTSAEPELGDTSDQTLGRALISTLLAILLLGSIVYFLARGGNFASEASEPSWLVADTKTTSGSRIELCGLPPKDGHIVAVNMVYSDDKTSWIEYAANRFARLCPSIQVKLTAMNDIEAAHAIANGEVQPTVWSPVDDLMIQYLDARWQKQSRGPLLHIGEQTSLVHSPLVILLWESQWRALSAILQWEESDEGPWMQTLCPLVPRDPDLAGVPIEKMVPGRWIDWYRPPLSPLPPPMQPSFGRLPGGEVTAASLPPSFPTLQEIEQWDRVKFNHTPPPRSASGLEALYLTAYDYVLPLKDRDAMPPATLAASDAGADFTRALAEQKDALSKWLRRCKAGLDHTPESTGVLTDRMFDVGPTAHDGVVTYEHLTFHILDRLDENAAVMRNLRVFYPQPTIVNRHPAVLLSPEDPAYAEQHEAARRWIAFLRSPAMQHKAIEFGFRPASPEIDIRRHDVHENPFLRLRRYGIVFESVLEEPPRLDSESLFQLVALWEDAIKRN